MGTGTVLLGNINPGQVSSNFMRSVMGFAIHDSTDREVFRGFLPWVASNLPDIMRNMVVDQFLTMSTHEWLWFVDSDITIFNDTLYKLLDSADPVTRPVVTGIYPTVPTSGHVQPSIYYRGKDDSGNLTMIQYPDIPIPMNDLVIVDGCGAGCLLIHRSILESMRSKYPKNKPWFENGIFDDIPYGEDFTFCMRVAEMGYRVYANTTVLVDHEKSVTLTLRNQYANT